MRFYTFFGNFIKPLLSSFIFLFQNLTKLCNFKYNNLAILTCSKCWLLSPVQILVWAIRCVLRDGLGARRDNLSIFTNFSKFCATSILSLERIKCGTSDLLYTDWTCQIGTNHPQMWSLSGSSNPFKFLTPSQSAYCKHHSTETALLYIHDHLINAIGSQKLSCLFQEINSFGWYNDRVKN